LQTDTTTDETTPSETTAETSESSVSSSSSEITASTSTSSAVTEASNDPWLTTELKQLLRNGLMWMSGLLVVGLFYIYRHRLFRIQIWVICRWSKTPLTQAYPRY